MATTSIQTSRCPVCNSFVDTINIASLGLSQDELGQLAGYVKKGTLGEVLSIAEIALRRLDPERTSNEFQVNEAMAKLREASNDMARKFLNEAKQFIEELTLSKESEKSMLAKEHQEKLSAMIKEMQNEIMDRTKSAERLEKDNQTKYIDICQSVKEIREKIIGIGIGDLAEIITIRDLKEMMPTDSFSEARASKGGTDIIGTVKENGVICGTITISSKCTQKWSGEFLDQITKDMRDDGSRFGVLVTKVFPREALSTKAWVMDTRDGKTVILVKPDYAPLAYFGLRQAVLHWFETRQLLKRKEDEADESEKTFKALMAWINGDEFEETIRYLDSATRATQETRNNLTSMRNYINTQIDKATKCQNSIDQYLIHTKSMMGKLRELLNSSNPDALPESGIFHNE